MPDDSSLTILGQSGPSGSPEPTPEARVHPLAEPTDAPTAPVRSLYIHIPFCFHKCHYCDFYSIVDRQDRQPAFTARLIDELAALAEFTALNRPLETIFIGGGTPTLLAPDLWESLLTALHRLFPLTDTTEFTVEANPETVTPDLARLLAGGGVNRVSIGAQSFNPAHLKTLERWHDPANVARALDAVRDAGIARQSLDLIFAIPGQTADDWQRDLDTALALGVSHLSAYNLTYEPGTAMTARLHRGDFDPSPEDLEVEMLDRLLDTTAAAGLDRYEVSNFAARGRECRHNLAYWQQRDWLAAGPSASGHVAGTRWKNTPRLASYLTPTPSALPPAIDIEPPDPRRALAEQVMTGVRLRGGLDRADLLDAASGLDASTRDRLATTIAAIDPELLDTTDPVRLALSRPGMLRADGLAADLMAALDPDND